MYYEPMTPVSSASASGSETHASGSASRVGANTNENPFVQYDIEVKAPVLVSFPSSASTAISARTQTSSSAASGASSSGSVEGQKLPPSPESPGVKLPRDNFYSRRKHVEVRDRPSSPISL